MRFLLFLISFLALAQVNAQSHTIWGNLTTGMTKDEVVSLYPEGKVDLAEGCYATIHPDYRNGRLVSVRLRVGDGAMRSMTKYRRNQVCAKMTMDSLIAKYGPNFEFKIEDNIIGNINSEKREVYTWRDGASQVEAKIRERNRDGVFINYSYDPIAKPNTSAAAVL